MVTDRYNVFGNVVKDDYITLSHEVIRDLAIKTDTVEQLKNQNMSLVLLTAYSHDHCEQSAQWCMEVQRSFAREVQRAFGMSSGIWFFLLMFTY